MPVLMICICFLLLLTGCIVSIVRSYHCLEVTYFQTVSEKIVNPVRMIILSDLHNRKFGRDNQRLISKVKEQKPDLILMAGDILDAEAKDDTVAVHLVKALASAAPVYYALGNHEIEFQKEHPDLLLSLKAAGANILEESYYDLQINSSMLRIGGMYGYAFQTEEGMVGNGNKAGYDFLTEFTDTDRFRITVFHRPESFVLGNAAKLWEMEMAVCAHIHGGQVILPFVGGIYGAELGWFPEYTYGKYKVKNTEMYLTRGLGSGGEALPRFHNLPEIMVVDLVSQGKEKPGKGSKAEG